MGGAGGDRTGTPKRETPEYEVEVEEGVVGDSLRDGSASVDGTGGTSLGVGWPPFLDDSSESWRPGGGLRSSERFTGLILVMSEENADDDDEVGEEGVGVGVGWPVGWGGV